MREKSRLIRFQHWYNYHNQNCLLKLGYSNCLQFKGQIQCSQITELFQVRQIEQTITWQQFNIIKPIRNSLIRFAVYQAKHPFHFINKKRVQMENTEQAEAFKCREASCKILAVALETDLHTSKMLNCYLSKYIIEQARQATFRLKYVNSKAFYNSLSGYSAYGPTSLLKRVFLIPNSE